MKRNILIFTLIFLLITFIYVLAFPNEPNDFRGIKWGTHISKIKGLQNKEQQGDDVLYTKKNDKLEIAEGVKINYIKYIFNKNRFVAIYLEASGQEYWNLIKNWFFKKYGEPNQHTGITPFAERHEWIGKKTEIWLAFLKKKLISKDLISLVIQSTKHK